MRYDGKVALVTGGGTGIGRALAAQLHAAGARVLICGRRADRLDAVCADHPGMKALACDVASTDGVDALADWLAQECDGLDLLFNNAGVQTQDDLTDPARGFEAIEAEIRTIFVAPIRLTQRLLPLLTGRRDAAIVNLVSALAVMGKPEAPVYGATKAGLLRQLAAGRDEIRIGQARSQLALYRFLPGLAGAVTRRRSAGATLTEEVAAAGAAHQGAGG